MAVEGPMMTAHRMTAQTPSAVASRVLRLEAQALTDMAAAVPADFDAAVAAILAMQGRLVVSGIGKSGHVGRKIAATFASTGTPAYFVHAVEASHGDLGMIGDRDICLLLSNSGETEELGDLNRPVFTGGQNSRRIARYGTCTKEEDFEAIFTRVPRTRGAAFVGTPR
jgi:DNA-binding MurR/RpiR family transcriptional regulator